MIAGIDYGSKMAGTTVICIQKGTQVILFQSQKNQDADLFIKKTLLEEISFKGNVFFDSQTRNMGNMSSVSMSHFLLNKG
jgi:hypothetical protein